ncbi:unnamed protein product [Allacma fusca]|uniref:Uncharacterized protein n=1 Tax=Allacma fusca TaxID=39272 RepID=A0A8J2P858_9HEXA|nr:unnamed protein product [Allacma fusca]
MKHIIIPIFLIFVFGQAAISVRQKLTYYWVVHENEFPIGSDANLNSCSGQNLAKSSKTFANRIALEGSGFLRDETTVLNLGSCISDSRPCKATGGNNYNCFEKTDAPIGSNDNPLIPYVSIASNDLRFGTTGIVQEFVNKKTPQGETHNGCVRVDDSCSTCNQKDWIDFYALSEANYEWFDSHWGLSNVNFNAQSCTPLKYRT